MGSFGGMEWLVIALAVLLLFGAKKIPELARGLGQGLTEFRKASSDIRKEIEKGSSEPTISERDQKSKKEPEKETVKEEQKSDN
ncbi:twin-arginine translocase TatA/TatE family subunit [Balneolales bacterium ANBcel1]|nr:twin-arginine translocase TatA/TatE family subunit [Balneolales bacterium ANBcel1]